MRICRTTLFKIFSRLLNSALIIFFLAHAGHWLDAPLLDRLENIAYDLRLRATMPNSVDNRIVIIDIDERSLALEGRWPWPRNKLAVLCDRLFTDYRIGLLAFDVVFSEPDNSSGVNWLMQLAQGDLARDELYLQALKKLQPRLAYDDIFAASMKNRAVVLGYFSQNQQQQSQADNALPPPLAASQPFARLLPLARSFGANLRVLQEAAGAGGYFNNPMVDQDGIYRRVPLLIEYQSSIYESLSLAIYRRYITAQKAEFITGQAESQEQATLEGVRLLDYTIPTDPHSAILVPYRGRQGSFNYYSATDILQGTVDPARLAGKIAIVGATAAGLMDLRSTPVQNVYPGVEVHANIVSGLLDQTIKSKPGYMPGFEMLEILLLGALAVYLFARIPPIAGFLLFALLAALVIGVNFAIWRFLNIDTILLSPLLLLSLLFIAQVSFGYFLETRRKKQLSRNFSQYVPPELVDQMVRSDDEFSLAGDSREMSVLFTDVRNFTDISESLDPQDLSDMMNGILSPITHVIHQHNGTIDKYMGDAVMAFWGAPLHDSAHARHAVAAALAIMPAIDEMNRRFIAKGWPRIAIGVGINCGQMSVGNMGSSFRMAYTVLGDAVNLGSRLEGLTKQYGVPIIVSESVRQQAPDFLYRELDRVRVKGKQEPITIYEPLERLDAGEGDQLEQLQIWRDALTHYRQYAWPAARELIARLAENSPETLLYKIYLQRIDGFLITPPPDDWDGVYTHANK